MNQQRHRTLIETTTTLAPAEVLAAARHFFSRRASIYAAFIEQESDTHVALRGQGNEEVIIGVRPHPAGTSVTASTYFFDQQVTRFLVSLPVAPAEELADTDTGDEQPVLPAGAGA